ncbi:MULTISPECIES: hypothetical protein [unclassified Streptomyces]|uniref:hypothetical protein n=1 Tax=unclassified Streptomyces TaxID=2593676 RepID=UPI00166032D1|nr:MULTISPECIES: hypothetical protein [unclassified Streptomyces]MBD0711560.1 hypothetical protein [Streptomyces sp. CBMA291]MBD0716564.1 hypothetical protein [Streptomyces sp. CBMA370]
MAWTAGRRVRLTKDLRLTGPVALDDGTPAGFLALGAGAEGAVERVHTLERQPSEAAREYERLKALLDSYGQQMPPESRTRLAEQVTALEPAWAAFQREKTRVTLRVRFDNGFVLDETPEDAFTAL